MLEVEVLQKVDSDPEVEVRLEVGLLPGVEARPEVGLGLVGPGLVGPGLVGPGPAVEVLEVEVPLLVPGVFDLGVALLDDFWPCFLSDVLP